MSEENVCVNGWRSGLDDKGWDRTHSAVYTLRCGHTVRVYQDGTNKEWWENQVCLDCLRPDVGLPVGAQHIADLMSPQDWDDPTTVNKTVKRYLHRYGVGARVREIRGAGYACIYVGDPEIENVRCLLINIDWQRSGSDGPWIGRFERRRSTTWRADNAYGWHVALGPAIPGKHIGVFRSVVRPTQG